jgi:sulfur-carrier protein adenylyltransferase/sulfurtransferase
LLWNALTMSVQTVRLAAEPNSRPIRELPAEIEVESCSDDGWEIEAGELRSMLHAGSVQLLDVREDWERQEDAILPSLHVPLGRLEDAADNGLVASLRADLPTVVYCAAGVRSLVAAAMLRESFGLHTVRSLRGGMHAWRATG